MKYAIMEEPDKPVGEGNSDPVPIQGDHFIIDGELYLIIYRVFDPSQNKIVLFVEKE